MPIFHKKAAVHVSPGAYIGLCVLLLLFPMEWVLSWMIAAAVHELCHYIGTWILKVRILSIGIHLNGARIITEPMAIWKECLTALAGPLGGIVLTLAADWFPKVAVCAFFQTVLNLFPIREFDGGRIINCMLRPLFEKNTADRISAAIEWVSLMLMFCVGTYLSFRYKTGILLPLVTVLLIVRRFKTKTPCKPGKQIVQCTQPNIRGRKHE